ncbi:MAG: protein kinase [Planctomycetes bacterium]|nr:protein kinase [Planctomycetota bacterium]
MSANAERRGEETILQSPTCADADPPADPAAFAPTIDKPDRDQTWPLESTRQPGTSALEPGRLFGRYRIQRRLGKGGMGAVFLAEDTELDRLVALKIPRFDEEESQTVVQRFYREARAAATISHPNICPIFDVGTIDGRQFLSMGYIEGRTLSQVVRDHGPLGSADVARIIRKVALALQEAHDRGVIHRDLKPANIMLDKRGEPIILDFGLARRRGKTEVSLTQAGAFLGTPSYMSPEQISGSWDEVGPASDVYSLGVIAYKLLTGVVPFEGELSRVLSAALLAPPKPPQVVHPGIDERLANICLKCLEKVPADRFASAAELAAALEPIAAAGSSVSGEPTTQRGASEPTLVQGVRPPTRPAAGVARDHRRQLAIAATAIVLVAVVAAAIFYGLRDSGSEASAAGTARGSEYPPSDKGVTATSVNDGTKPSQATAAQPVASTGEPPVPHLGIHVKLSRDEQGYRELTSRLVPLPHGAMLQLHVQLPRPAYVYLYWYDAEGQPRRLWPKSLDDQQPVAEVWDPPQTGGEFQDMYPLEGAAGLEMALAATSDRPLSARELDAFERLPLEVAVAAREGGDLRLVRALGPQVAVQKGERVADGEGALLLIPSGADNRLVVVESSQTRRLADVTRSLGQAVPVPKGRPLFENRLDARFAHWFGLMFPHAPPEAGESTE